MNDEGQGFHCYWTWVGGGGGGSPPPPPPPQPPSPPHFDVTAISAKLQCALDNYATAAPLSAIKHEDAWKYQNRADPTVFRVSATQLNLDQNKWANVLGQTPIAGGTWSGGTSFLYNKAFVTNTKDWSYITPSGLFGRIDGPFTPFEISLFAAAHEAAHQHGLGISNRVIGTAELHANYYGEEALRHYRDDNGALCQ